MRHTLAFALFVTIVLTVWAVAYQFACDDALRRAQQAALQPPPTMELAYGQPGKPHVSDWPARPAAEPVSCITADDFNIDE